MFGISKGAIKTSLILGDDKRISAGVMVLGGGNLSEFLPESQERGVKKARLAYIEENGSGVEAFKLALEKSLTIDPLDMAKYVDGRKTLHVLAYFDTAVPYSYGKELYQAMPGAELYTILAGHYTAILYLPFILNRSEAFYQKKLNLGQ